MTLNDLATFICTKISQSETEDIAACKTFLQRRRDMIWADALWKDSLGEFTQSLSASGYTTASTWLPTQKILLLPTAFDAVVAARTADRYLNVERSEIFYRTDFDTFASQGNARQYRLLPPAVWGFDTAQTLGILSQVADVGQTGTVDTVGADGVSVTRTAISFGAQATVASVLTVLSLSKTVTAQNVLGGVYPAGPTVTNNSGFTGNVMVDALGYIIPDGSSLAVAPGSNISCSFGPNGNIGVTAIPGDITFAGTIAISLTDFTFTGQPSNSFTVANTDLNAAKRQRIQLLGALPDPTTIRVLGKLRAPTFTADNDEPGLTGIENCLLAFAQADMLERERQYGKAASCMQEGATLLAQLKKVETVQQAHNQRFVPEQGYRDEWNLVSGSPISF